MLPHLEGWWLISVGSFLRSIHGSLELSNPQILPPQRSNDIYLMDIALASKFTPLEVRNINLCRLFFNAVTLSDITNASGTRLNPGVCNGTTLLSQSHPSGPRVKQPRPDNPAWASWRQLLRRFSDLTGVLHANHQLGDWLVSGGALRRQWPFIFPGFKTSYTGPMHQNLPRTLLPA
jgi:hypothetical protein